MQKRHGGPGNNLMGTFEDIVCDNFVFGPLAKVCNFLQKLCIERDQV